MLSLSGGRAFSSHPQPDAERFFRPYRPTMVGNDEPTHQAKQPEVQNNSPTRTPQEAQNERYNLQYSLIPPIKNPS